MKLNSFYWDPLFFIADSVSTQNFMKNSYPIRCFRLRLMFLLPERKIAMFQTPTVTYVIKFIILIYLIKACFGAKLRGGLSFQIRRSLHEITK